MAKILKENEVGHIYYNKEVSGNLVETTERFIVPTNIPKTNIKALDVTSLSQEERDRLIELHKEYQKYVKERMKTIYSFDDWIEASYPSEDKIEIKHRTFKINNIQLK